MRPQRLELKGFAAFRESTIIDFGDVDLAAFVGPTGAGKSSIIDGIGFALYGSVARYRKTNIVAPVINQLATEARVRLDFTVAGTEYTAVRVVRRTPRGASTREARLESGARVLAGTAGELDAAVEDLLGLDFEQFTKTAVLPQGDFARFLTESASDRQALLRRLLGVELYRSMASAARDRARSAELTRVALADQLGRLPAATGAEIAATEAGIETLEATIDDVRILSERLDDERDRAASNAAVLDHLDLRIKATEDLRSVPRDVVDLARSIEEADSRFERLEQQQVSARAALADATRSPDPTESSIELGRVLELRRELDELDARAGAVATEAEAARRTRADAVAAADRARAELDDGRLRLGEARLFAGARGLVDSLVPGEPCPVCRQPVSDIPPIHDHPDLDELERTVDESTAMAAAALERLTAATAAHATAQAVVDTTAERRSRLRAGLGDETRTAAELEAELTRSRTAIERLEQLRQNEVRAAEDVAAARADRRVIDERSVELRRELIDARDGVADLDPPQPGGVDLAQDWRDLAEWAARTQRQLRDEQALAGDRASESRVAIEHLVAEIDERCSPLVEGFDPGRSAVEQLAVQHSRLETALTELRVRRIERAELEGRVAELAEQSGVATELGRLLGSAGFERWLLADIMQTLASRASARLLELSAGAYSLTTDGSDFAVCDHRNADDIRSARTLSGGETFLASLALALALTDNLDELAVDGPAHIESMFLDEGFGTLDPETLDIVAGAIEELGSQGHMVGVVTHIRELADRMPVRFEVSRRGTSAAVDRIDG